MIELIRSGDVKEVEEFWRRLIKWTRSATFVVLTLHGLNPCGPSFFDGGCRINFKLASPGSYEKMREETQTHFFHVPITKFVWRVITGLSH